MCVLLVNRHRQNFDLSINISIIFRYIKKIIPWVYCFNYYCCHCHWKIQKNFTNWKIRSHTTLHCCLCYWILVACFKLQNLLVTTETSISSTISWSRKQPNNKIYYLFISKHIKILLKNYLWDYLWKTTITGYVHIRQHLPHCRLNLKKFQRWLY